MKRSPVYLRWREDTILEGKRRMAQNFFKVRFGELDSELSAIIEPMLQLPEEDPSVEQSTRAVRAKQSSFLGNNN